MQVLLAEQLSSLGNGDEAISVLRKAEGALPIRPLSGRSRRARSVLKLAIITISRSQGDLRSAVEEGNKALRSLKWTGDEATRAHMLIEMALAYDGMGDVENARKMLDQAETALREVEDPNGIVAVLIRKGMLEEKEGNTSRALEQYRAALWHAEKVGDVRAAAFALENIALAMEPGTEEWKKTVGGSIDRLRDIGATARAERLEAMLKGAHEEA